MGIITLDLTNYRDRTSANVPEGRYRLQVEDVEEGTSKGAKTSGATMLTVYLRIMEGEYNGQTMIDRFIVAESTMFRIVGFLQGLGIPTPRKRIQINPESWRGKIVDADVEDGEPYNGRVRSEIRGYVKVARPASRDEGDVLDLDEGGAEEAPSSTPPAGAVQAAEADTSSDVLDLDEIQL